MSVIQNFTLVLIFVSNLLSAKEVTNLSTFVDNFHSDVESLIKKPDDCQRGALKFRTDRANSLFDLMSEAPHKVIEYKGNNSFDEPSEINEYRQAIEAWSLYNIDDYQTYQAMKANEESLIVALSNHYQKELSYSASEAITLARKVVETVIVRVFTAFDYLPITNEYMLELRKAILEKKSIEIIQGFTDKEKLQNPYDSNKVIEERTVYGGHYYPSATEKESLLSIAIDYPQALEHLLKIGINPNHKNLFGKTPLMYAAQRNQLESAKILLEHGAKINNATTKIYSERCSYYALNQYNVTSLHYAVRYADKALIELLLAEGASIHSLSALRNNTHKIPSGLPYKWLNFREIKLNKKEFTELKKQLMPAKHNKQINQDK